MGLAKGEPARAYGAGSELIGSVEIISDIIAAVGFSFAAILVPTLVNRRSYISRLSSGPTWAGLVIVGFCFLDLSLWTAAVSQFVCGSAWLALFIWRGTPPKASATLAAPFDRDPVPGGQSQSDL